MNHKKKGTTMEPMGIPYKGHSKIQGPMSLDPKA